MKATHLTISQSAIAAFIVQISALVGGFGVVDNTTVGIWTNVLIAIVNVAFLVANAIHALAHAKTVVPQLPPTP